jgi:phosphatidylinositol 4-kinase
MDAAASFTDFWPAEERLLVIQHLQRILSETFLVLVEAGLSIIRNSGASRNGLREWKRLAKYYATTGRPLGAMLLQDALMRFIVACTSLFVADTATLRQKSSLDVLSSRQRGSIDTVDSFREGNTSSIEPLVDILNQEMNLLEDGADFLRLGSTWQQRLGFAVKAHVLTSYVNCVMVDDELADAEVLMEWLDETIVDPVQMADPVLSTAVLKSMAVVATLSSDFASTLSKSLPRFIVQGGSRTEIVEVASQSLSRVLQLLSQDSIITTLYTLGNVLSSGTANIRLVADENNPNGSTRGQKLQLSKETTGSSISLALNGEAETSIVFQNVIKSIVVIAVNCKDEKITALAQAILIQKVGKLRNTIDAHILVEIAPLGMSGGQSEFKSMLKSYSKFLHESVARDDETTAEAVSDTLRLADKSILTIIDFASVHLSIQNPKSKIKILPGIHDPLARIRHQ